MGFSAPQAEKANTKATSNEQADQIPLFMAYPPRSFGQKSFKTKGLIVPVPVFSPSFPT
jgi:hypothetical protein